MAITEDKTSLAFSYEELVHLSAGMALLIEFITGHAAFASKSSDTDRLLSNIEDIILHHRMSSNDLNSLISRIKPPIIEKNNVGILPC